jgi:recombination protein RecA
MVELSGGYASAVLTVSTGLILEAQRAGEPAAWIAARETFFPPDLAESGVDLAALPVVHVADPGQALRAADRLLRSGSFALLVLDLGRATQLPLPAQTRLSGLAQRHDTALLFLTVKQEETPSLGSLISLHARASQRELGPGRFLCEVQVVKDKRRGPGQTYREVCRGPAGLR